MEQAPSGLNQYWALNAAAARPCVGVSTRHGRLEYGGGQDAGGGPASTLGGSARTPIPRAAPTMMARSPGMARDARVGGSRSSALIESAPSPSPRQRVGRPSER